MKPIATIAALAVAGTLFAEKMPFERYQSIIDRQPFGQPPPGFNPQQMASDVSRSAADEVATRLSPPAGGFHALFFFLAIISPPVSLQTRW